MKNQLLLFLLINLMFSCTSNPNKQMTKEESWKLGWKMNENILNQNFEVADSQFDSLLSLNKEIEVNFLTAGLENKSQLGKNEEVDKILNNQTQETLNRICFKQFAKNLAPCKGISAEKVDNESLQNELIGMYVKDQAIRGNVMKELMSKYKIDESFLAYEVGIDIDEVNRNRLKEIIEEYGFPNQKLVGKDAMDGIFYIIQHSDHDSEWQKSQLGNIEKAVKNGSMDGQNYAYLYDRIKVNNEEKQLYGTQFSKVDRLNKTVELFETEDIANLDKRRLDVGMMPIEMYKRIMIKVSSE